MIGDLIVIRLDKSGSVTVGCGGVCTVGFVSGTTTGDWICGGGSVCMTGWTASLEKSRA